MLAFHLVSVAIMFAHEHGLREPIDFIFDHQSAEQEVLGNWEQYKRNIQISRRPYLLPLIGDPFFLDEKDRRPLQAADLYVWQARNHYVENHRFKNQKIIVPMNHTLRLFRGIPTFHAPMTEKVMVRQYNGLVRTGERLKKQNPSLKLIPVEADRKLRRKIRKKTRQQKRRANLTLGFSRPLGGVGIIFLNARSNASSSESAPTSSAVSMNRFDCSASSGFIGFRVILHSNFYLSSLGSGVPTRCMKFIARCCKCSRHKSPK